MAIVKKAPVPVVKKACPEGFVTLSSGEHVKFTTEEDGRMLRVAVFGENSDAVDSREARTLAMEERDKVKRFRNAGMDPIMSTDTVPVYDKSGKHTHSNYQRTYKFKVI